MTLSDQERQQLCDTAREVAKLSYSPYSRFRVGAAVLTNKKIYAGTNVENASYGLSLCAERATLAQIIAAGDREVRAIAIACIDGIRLGLNKGVDDRFLLPTNHRRCSP